MLAACPRRLCLQWPRKQAPGGPVQPAHKPSTLRLPAAAVMSRLFFYQVLGIAFLLLGSLDDTGPRMI